MLRTGSCPLGIFCWNDALLAESLWPTSFRFCLDPPTTLLLVSLRGIALYVEQSNVPLPNDLLSYLSHYQRRKTCNLLDIWQVVDSLTISISSAKGMPPWWKKKRVNVLATRANASREKLEPHVTRSEGQPTRSTEITKATWEDWSISKYVGSWTGHEGTQHASRRTRPYLPQPVSCPCLQQRSPCWSVKCPNIYFVSASH